LHLSVGVPHQYPALSKDVSAPSLASTFLLDSFVPVLSAASSPATPEGEGGGSGDCVNPHPGEFRIRSDSAIR
jgi:hypothetical protein